MRAAVIEGPHRMTVRDDVPQPPLGDYDARCRLLFGATCTGTDSHIIDGDFPWISQLPTILGHETIGRVVEVGPKVRHLRVGDLVSRVGTLPAGEFSVTWGGFAEFGIAKDVRAMREDGLPRSQWWPHRIFAVLPADTDPAAATMLITWRETRAFAQNMGIQPGSSVVVLGTGGNGLAFTSHARNMGAGVVAVIGSASRRDHATRAGATHFVNYRSEDAPAQAGAVAPDGFDFAVDAVGKVGMPDQALALLRPGGAMGIYGIDDRGKLTLDPLRARGTFTVVGPQYDEMTAHDVVLRELRDGRLDPTIWLDLDEAYPLDRIHDAFQSIRQRQRVKALVKLSEDA